MDWCCSVKQATSFARQSYGTTSAHRVNVMKSIDGSARRNLFKSLEMSRCPHGEPIPSKEGVMPIIKDMPLLEVPSGSDCIISRVRTHNMEKLHYIGELGHVPGTPFHLLSCAPFKGPLRLQLKPRDHVIGYELAGSLWVEVTKRGSGNKLPKKE
jgi:Fe2+ transport system protein FeoA